MSIYILTDGTKLCFRNNREKWVLWGCHSLHPSRDSYFRLTINSMIPEQPEQWGRKSCAHHYILQCKTTSYSEIPGGRKITRLLCPTTTASLTQNCCRHSCVCLVRGSVLTCSSESTVQLLCLSCSPFPPAPGEGDIIPAKSPWLPHCCLHQVLSLPLGAFHSKTFSRE